MKHYLVLTLFIISLHLNNANPPPPVWPDTFSQDYVIYDATVKTHSVGKIWYDSKNNCQRVDVSNSWFDYVCNTLSPRANTTCISMNVNDYLYYWLPDQNKCCKCCAAKNGCGVKPKDWLKNYKYTGVVSLNQQVFNRWSVNNPRINEKYYSAVDQNNTPRRMESGTLTLDYVMNTYSENQIPASVFRLPNYCENRCPSLTFCAQIDQDKSKQKFGFQSSTMKTDKFKNIRFYEQVRKG